MTQCKCKAYCKCKAPYDFKGFEKAYRDLDEILTYMFIDFTIGKARMENALSEFKQHYLTKVIPQMLCKIVEENPDFRGVE